MVTLSGVISHATELGGTVKQGIKQLSGSAGAALIELAMVLPLIVMLILGMGGWSAPELPSITNSP